MRYHRSLFCLAALTLCAGVAACDPEPTPDPAPPAEEPISEPPTEVVECDPAELPAGEQCP